MTERRNYRFSKKLPDPDEVAAEALIPPPPPAAARSDMRSEEAGAPKRTRLRKGGGMSDRFYIDPTSIPAGMSYEWKRFTCKGQEDPAYAVEMAEQGWEPVMVDRHRNYMPKNYQGAIIRDGMMLMERPVELTQEARDEEAHNARAVVRAKELQLSGAPPGTLDRTLAKVSRKFEGGLSEGFEIPG